MILPVIFTPEAEADVVDAYAWYEARVPGLGEEYLRCVEACVTSVCRNPNAHPVAIDSFRGALVRRFPFKVFYEADDDVVVIYAVFHCSQNPENGGSGYAGANRNPALRATP